MIDLGDDAFTRGRPHPMFEPGVRDAPLAEALADPAVGVILLDVVLGYGGHADPAGHLAAFLAGTGAPPADRRIRHRHRCRSAAARGAGAQAGRGRRDGRGFQCGRHGSRDRGARRRPLRHDGRRMDDRVRSCDRACWRRNSAATSRRRRIEAVFARSLYLRAGDRFICIGGPDIGSGPVHADGELPVGSRPAARASRLRSAIGTSRSAMRSDFTLDRSEPWRAPAWPACPSPARLIETGAILAGRARPMRRRRPRTPPRRRPETSGRSLLAASPARASRVSKAPPDLLECRMRSVTRAG